MALDFKAKAQVQIQQDRSSDRWNIEKEDSTTPTSTPTSSNTQK